MFFDPINTYICCPCSRDQAFKLKPLNLSSDLIKQLRACAVKLDAEAEQLQGMIHKKLNRNKDYVTIIARVWGPIICSTIVHTRFILPTRWMSYVQLSFIKGLKGTFFPIIYFSIQVEDIKKVVTERLSLAKALVRAPEKPAGGSNSKGKKPKDKATAGAESGEGGKGSPGETSA